MHPRKPLRLVLVAAVVLLLSGLATAANAPLLTNPGSPSSGKYLRMADNKVIQFDAYWGTAVPVGDAMTGIPLGNDPKCDTNEVGWCADSQTSECLWNPAVANAQWTQPQDPAAFVYGRCMAIRAYTDGATDVRVQFRPAIRTSVATIDQPGVAQLNGVWTYKAYVLWKAGSATPQPQDETTTVLEIGSNCIVDTATQQSQFPLAGNVFANCVWGASEEIPIYGRIPHGLTVNGQAAIVNGFEARAMLIHGDVVLPVASASCRGCITPFAS